MVETEGLTWLLENKAAQELEIFIHYRFERKLKLYSTAVVTYNDSLFITLKLFEKIIHHHLSLH